MYQSKVKDIISIIFKIICIISCFVGFFTVKIPVTSKMLQITLLYFTTQSNFWIAGAGIVGIVFIILGRIKKKNLYKNWMYVIRLVLTISISLTGFVFCGILSFSVDNAWSLSNILLHVVVPAISIADFFIYYKNYRFHHYQALFCLIPPLYYLVFSIFGYVCHWDFDGLGTNYPYFFLNYGSPAGIFGFSNEPAFIGCFYWIVILFVLVVLLSIGYISLTRLFNKKLKNS